MADPVLEGKIVEAPEFSDVTQLMQALRAVIAEPKYDHITVSELTGAFEMLKFEYLASWDRS
jgi:hypothetical protein